MKAAVVPVVSSPWQIEDVPQPKPGPQGLRERCGGQDLLPRGPHNVITNPSKER